MPFGRRAETAFEVAKHKIRSAELVSDQGEWDRRVGHIHQVDVTSQYQFRHDILSTLPASVW